MNLATGLGFEVVTSAKLGLVNTEWAPADRTQDFPTVTATMNPSSTDPLGSGGGGYTAHSTACHDLVWRGEGLVFRDGGGKIVGGTLYKDNSFKKNQCKAGDFTGSNGTSGKLPSTYEPSKTDISVYCDVLGQTNEPGIGIPAN